MKFFLAVLAVSLALAQCVPVPRRERNRVGKIVGGQDASEGEFPYQISFRDRALGGDFHFCGGSILDDMTMIDAGHCVDGENYNSPVNLQIVAGELVTHDETNAQRRDVVKIVLHENYNTATLENDISLLKIDSPLTFNFFVDQIILPARGSEPQAGDNFIVTGWGTTDAGGAASTMQYVTVPYVDDETCRENYVAPITDSMICAGKTGYDSCQGDSGGPMVKDDGTKEQVGVVSWGNGCGDEGFPGVYTQVSYFIDWINTNRG